MRWRVDTGDVKKVNFVFVLDLRVVSGDIIAHMGASHNSIRNRKSSNIVLLGSEDLGCTFQERDGPVYFYWFVRSTVRETSVGAWTGLRVRGTL